MEMISFPRTGLNGELFSQDCIEKSFIEGLVKDITDRLKDISTVDEKESEVIKYLSSNLEYLLLAKPLELERIKNTCDSTNLFGPPKEKRTKQFKKQILDAFGYKQYRSNRLINHAEKLNVKTCCYCNLNYTLFVEEKEAGKINKKALLQFDHFYDKNIYPHLSMSLYNLIPSCATCNQGKPRKGNLPIIFNPYFSSIFDYYRFRVKEPLDLYLDSRNTEKIDVECRKINNEDISACDKWFHLSAKYSVNKDIVEEIFEKARQYPYYANYRNFLFLKGDTSDLLRLLLGVYTKKEDMIKRPMSKFETDIWNQALLFYGKVFDQID